LLQNSAGGFSLAKEHEAMTVVTLASRRAAPAVPCVHTPAHPATPAQATHLRTLALSHLQRCGHMLTASHPMYAFAVFDLDAAKAAIEALQLLERA
jgi:hypothetical protein